MMKPTKLLFLSLILLSNTALADTELMQETLRRIQHVLKQTAPLINAAEAQQDKNARVQFDYDALRDDIAKIESGIDAELKKISIQPRMVKPLQGDYEDNVS